jgi:hypothetical protein
MVGRRVGNWVRDIIVLVSSFRGSVRSHFRGLERAHAFRALSTGGVVIPNPSQVTELRAMSWECRVSILDKVPGPHPGQITIRTQMRRCRSTAGGHFVGTTLHSGTGARELFQRVIKTQRTHTFVRAGQSMISTLLLYWFLLVPAVMHGA